jgi:ribosomal protein S18 acetylase RimI-like enzyme
MVGNLLACWERIAEGADGAAVRRLPGAAVAVFPSGPERIYYNNAILERGLDAAAVRETLDQVLGAYDAAGVERYAVWAHDTEQAAQAELDRRGLHVDTWTRAMAMTLGDASLPSPEFDVAPSDWDTYLRFLRIIGVPDGLLAGVDPGGFYVLVARLEGEDVAAGIAYDYGGDCGIYNVVTLEHLRRRGLGTAVTAAHLHGARQRGCATASLQATEEAERIYAALGFRDLGRFIEYVP